MTIRHLSLFLLGGLGLMLAGGCGQSEDVVVPEKDGNFFAGATVGTDTTLEVVTWNIEGFPKAGGDTTLTYVAEAVEAMDADIVAVQEISSGLTFDRLVAALDGWSGFRATSNTHINLGYLYREGGGLEMESIYEILPGEFALERHPLVFEGTFHGTPFVVIDNHYWCCGDGILIEGDWENREYRREQASLLLDDFIRTNFAGERVFMVGDLNDELTDPPDRNVFQVFLDAPADYRFVDMPIAEGPATGWSYPGWPSHLDHILVTAPLFAAVDVPAALVQVVPLYTYFQGGYREYDKLVSDHLPVVLRAAVD